MRIPVVPFLFLALLWNFFVFLPPQGIPSGLLWIFLVPISLFLAQNHLNSYIDFKVDQIRAKYGFFCFIAIVILSLPLLQLSLAGDELYHAEVSNPVLMKLNGRDQSHVNDPQDWSRYIDQLSQSYKKFFATRYLPVKEVWRIKSLIGLSFLTLFSLWVLFYRKFSKTQQWLSILVALISSSLVGYFWGLGPELHSPLRNLPAFIGQSLFGLEDWAFKIPAHAATVFFLFYWTKHLANESQPKNSLWLSFVLGACLFFIPVVFYSLNTFEPSFWAFLIATTFLIKLHQLLTETSATKQSTALMGLLLGLGSLMRPTLIFYSPLLVFALLIRRKEISLQKLGSTFLPLLFIVPFLASAFTGAYTGALDSQSISLPSLMNGWVNGSLSFPLLYNLGPLWAVFVLVLFLGVMFLFFKTREVAYLLVLYFPFIFVLFHLKLSSSLWGVGRYQAEYFAPFVGLMIFQISQTFFKGTQKNTFKYFSFVSPLVAILLILQSLSLNYSLSSEVNYNEWNKMRISTSAYIPYKKALEYVKNSEAAGSFLILGGQPWYGPMPLWLAGHSLSDSTRWLRLQNKFKNLNPNDFDSFMNFLGSENIKFVLIQSGTKRESQHQTPFIKQLISKIKSSTQNTSSPIQFYLEHDYGPEMGGYFSVYSVTQK